MQDPYAQILTSVATAALTTIVVLSLKKIMNWISLKTRKYRWKTFIPKEYPHRDEIITKLKKNSQVKISGKKYRVGGFILYKADGERCFDFLLQNECDRWVEFHENEIILWGRWNDPELWGSLGPKEQPKSYKTVGEVENSETLTIDNVKLKIIDSNMNEVLVMWGQWGKGEYIKDTKCYFADAVIMINNEEATLNNRKLFASLLSYGGSKENSRIFYRNRITFRGY